MCKPVFQFAQQFLMRGVNVGMASWAIMEILREIFLLANMPRGLTRKTTIWGSHAQAFKEWEAFADGDLLSKPEIRFSGLTIAKSPL